MDVNSQKCGGETKRERDRKINNRRSGNTQSFSEKRERRQKQWLMGVSHSKKLTLSLRGDNKNHSPDGSPLSRKTEKTYSDIILIIVEKSTV